MQRPWILKMEWRDLLFVHWPLPPPVLAAALPAGVTLDLWEGQAWLALVAFNVTNFRVRGVPFGMSFPQVNLRTYVRLGETRGIWTFSLDAAPLLAVLGSRLGYALPYVQARAALQVQGDWLEFRSVRRHQPDLDCHVGYRPTGPVFRAPAGSTEHWLTERRSLFTVGWDRRLWRADVQHEAWPLQAAEIRHFHSRLPAQVGAPSLGPPLAHFSRVVHVRGWPPAHHQDL
ncbi:YqjF family protein [Deinococcus hohokamensis]|uniref:YqjF family protein n=1 Tax=Deinococcus hohokamensis TaxID=309883 RepID=A0ABV9IBQ2_9DEIO